MNLKDQALKNRLSSNTTLAIIGLILALIAIGVGIWALVANSSNTQSLQSQLYTTQTESTATKVIAGQATSGAVVTGPIPTNGTAKIEYDTEEFDDNSYWDIGDPTVITIPANAIYNYGVTCNFQAPDAGRYRISVTGIEGCTESYTDNEPTISLFCQAELTSGTIVEATFEATNTMPATAGTCKSVVEEVLAV